MPRSRRRRRLLVGAVGMFVSFLCLWLVFEYVDLRQAGATLLATDGRWLLVAMAIFWIANAIRILRWRLLLAHVADLDVMQVGEILILGYSMNCLLPARLGEPFRAEYAQRRFGVDRLAVFGSIVTERVLDGLFTATILIGGLALTSFGQRAPGLSAFNSAAAIGLFVFVGAGGLILAARHLNLEKLPGPAWLSGIVGRLRAGAAMSSGPTLSLAFVCSALIWGLEVLAFWALLVSIGVDITIANILVLFGAGSLSVLAPAAPGQIGTLQLVFAVVMEAFAQPPASGVAAATLVQTAFFGSWIVAAAAIVVVRSLVAMFGQLRTD